jgi:hypothetical protein
VHKALFGENELSVPRALQAAALTLFRTGGR